MININAFSKNHINGKRNRECIKSSELLARIDKAIAAKEVSAKELDDLEQTIRCTSQCFVPKWLMTDLYDTTGITVKFEEPKAIEMPKVEKPIDKPEITKPIGDGEPTVSGDYQADKVEEPIKGTDPDGGVIGEQGEMGKVPTENAEPEKTDVKDEGVNDEGVAPDTTEPSNAPANGEPTEEIDGVPADTQEPTPETQEPAPDNDEQPADETAAPKKGGRKKKDAAE